MDNRDREKLNSDKSSSSSDDSRDFNQGDSSSGSWDNEPSRSQSGGMSGDKGRSGGIERESDSGSIDRSELEH